MKVNKLMGLCFLLVFAISACAVSYKEAMQRFVLQKDRNVSLQANISGYLKQTSGVVLESVQEVRPGVMEYSFKDKLHWFVAEERRCKFIFVVRKDTGTVIGWRYNGNPENCLQSK